MEIKKLTITDADYPLSLKIKLRSAAPRLLYYCGDLSILKSTFLGMVGSREIDEKDKAFTEAIAKAAVSKGFAIVSGGARGTDSAARDAALRSSGCCVEFLAGNLADKLNDDEAIKYIEAGKLLCMSAEPPDAPFSAAAALGRNKYIFALSEAATVTRCDYQKGGSWQGPTNALRFGTCKVYVNSDPRHRGNRGLIDLGAIPIDSKWNAEL